MAARLIEIKEEKFQLPKILKQRGTLQCILNSDAEKSAVNAFSVKLSHIARLRAKKSGKCEKNLWGEKQVLDSFTSHRGLEPSKKRSLYAISTIDSSCNPPWLLASWENERWRVSTDTTAKIWFLSLQKKS